MGARLYDAETVALHKTLECLGYWKKWLYATKTVACLNDAKPTCDRGVPAGRSAAL